ncbi:uncharacterized protein LOC121771896 [Salvia splendens]|uniref:uncharacterized protein LOC121771896 n=1 Tax=Salvia splendens TaxID=180675 RepID=UPI001C26A12E|nr:uncharacterized protein LOC121771896 [Salvia splendens]
MHETFTRNAGQSRGPNAGASIAQQEGGQPTVKPQRGPVMGGALDVYNFLDDIPILGIDTNSNLEDIDEEFPEVDLAVLEEGDFPDMAATAEQEEPPDLAEQEEPPELAEQEEPPAPEPPSRPKRARVMPARYRD